MTAMSEASVRAVQPAGQDGSADPLRLGSAIRAARRYRGLTLVELAQEAGLSHPFLSQIERGKASPSMASLGRIALALGSSQIELLAGADPAAGDETAQHTPEVTRVDQGPRGLYGRDSARLLAGSRDAAFTPLEIAGSGTGTTEYYRHSEDEFLYVVLGTVLVDLGEAGEHVLTAGDSLYFEGGTAHRWHSPDGSPYQLIVVKQGRDATQSASAGGVEITRNAAHTEEGTPWKH